MENVEESVISILERIGDGGGARDFGGREATQWEPPEVDRHGALTASLGYPGQRRRAGDR